MSSGKTWLTLMRETGILPLHVTKNGHFLFDLGQVVPFSCPQRASDMRNGIIVESSQTSVDVPDRLGMW
jgi:hypothetical protein